MESLRCLEFGFLNLPSKLGGHQAPECFLSTQQAKKNLLTKGRKKDLNNVVCLRPLQLDYVSQRHTVSRSLLRPLNGLFVSHRSLRNVHLCCFPLKKKSSQRTFTRTCPRGASAYINRGRSQSEPCWQFAKCTPDPDLHSHMPQTITISHEKITTHGDRKQQISPASNSQRLHVGTLG